MKKGAPKTEFASRVKKSSAGAADITIRVSTFVSHLYERWQRANRKEDQFKKMNAMWLAAEFRMPDQPIASLAAGNVFHITNITA